MTPRRRKPGKTPENQKPGSRCDRTDSATASTGGGPDWRAGRRHAARGDRPGPAFPRHPRRGVPAQGRRRPGRGRDQPVGDPGPDPGPGRRVGLREDHHRPAAGPAGRADQRPDRDRRARRHAPAAGPDAPAAARHPDDLPGSLLFAQPQANGRRDRRRPVPAAEGQRARRGQAQRAGTARTRRPQPRALQPLPARVLRWPAAAHRDRPHPGPAAQADRGRRTGERPRRVDPGPGHQPARGPAGRAGPDLRGDRARPVGGPAHQRPGGGHVPGQDRRDRRPGEAVRQAAAPVHGGAAVGGSGARAAQQPDGPARAARAHQAGGRRTEPAAAAACVPLPHPVLEGAADLPDHRAAAGRADPRSPGGVPLPGEHAAGVRERSGQRPAAGLNVHPAAGWPLPITVRPVGLGEYLRCMAKLVASHRLFRVAAACGVGLLSAAGLMAPAAVLAAPSAQASELTITSTGTRPGAIKHVWLIILENKSYDATFSGLNQNTYLWKTLPAQGVLLKNYYGTGHSSQDNYLSMVSGQAPEEDTQEDCSVSDKLIGPNSDIISTGSVLNPKSNYGQMQSPANASQPSGANAPLGANGCTYPTDVPTLFNQFNAAGVSWKGYAQDIGGEQTPGSTQFVANTVPNREGATCAGPGTPANNPDTNPTNMSGDFPAGVTTLTAAQSNDQYVAKHFPFPWFESL